MAKRIQIIIILFQLSCSMFGQEVKQSIVSTDINNFWLAYDKIHAIPDSLLRIKLINDLYIGKGSKGLKALIMVRRYTDVEYVSAILKYPKYWESIRENSLNVQKDSKEIERYLQSLKELYPELKPATIYLSIGVFRSGGTYHDDNVLLGGEFLFAQQNSVIDELPERIQNVIRNYAPNDIPLIAVHESIHTQQKRWENGNILQLCVAEGVAEFISTLVTQKPLSPPVRFGKENPELVLNKFMEDVFRDNDVWNWLWSENQNELKVNDLGYYIGYSICERYYNNALDKKKAIKDLIELDYSDEVEFARIVESTGFLPMTLKEIDAKYEALRPKIKGIVEFQNESLSVSPKLNVITIEFSEPMSDCCRSFDFELTKKYVKQLKVKNVTGWSEDKHYLTLEVEPLKPNTNYTLTISNFAKEDGGNRTAPYIIKFKTAKK